MSKISRPMAELWAERFNEIGLTHNPKSCRNLALMISWAMKTGDVLVIQFAKDREYADIFCVSQPK